jgi:hypothetical protein
MDLRKSKMNKLKVTNLHKIGSIGNYYGGLRISRIHDKPYWGIENHDGTLWEEISEELYSELQKHENKPEAETIWDDRN